MFIKVYDYLSEQNNQNLYEFILAVNKNSDVGSMFFFNEGISPRWPSVYHAVYVLSYDSQAPPPSVIQNVDMPQCAGHGFDKPSKHRDKKTK